MSIRRTSPHLHPPISPSEEDRGELAGLALSTGNGEAIYAPFAGLGTCLAGPHVLATWLADARVPKLAHFREGLVVALHRRDLKIAGMIGDSAFASHLTQPSNWAPHDLSIVAKHVLVAIMVMGLGVDSSRASTS